MVGIWVPVARLLSPGHIWGQLGWAPSVFTFWVCWQDLGACSGVCSWLPVPFGPGTMDSHIWGPPPQQGLPGTSFSLLSSVVCFKRFPLQADQGLQLRPPAPTQFAGTPAVCRGVRNPRRGLLVPMAPRSWPVALQLSVSFLDMSTPAARVLPERHPECLIEHGLVWLPRAGGGGLSQGLVLIACGGALQAAASMPCASRRLGGAGSTLARAAGGSVSWGGQARQRGNRMCALGQAHPWRGWVGYSSELSGAESPSGSRKPGHMTSRLRQLGFLLNTSKVTAAPGSRGRRGLSPNTPFKSRHLLWAPPRRVSE